MQRALGERNHVAVLAISPGEPELLRRLREHLGLRIPLLSDPSWSTYRDYGLQRGRPWKLAFSPRLWLRYAGLLLRGRRPSRPTENVFELGGDALVDHEGRLAWIHRSENVLDRPSVGEILEQLHAL